MVWRGLGAVVALAVVGVAGGFGVAIATGDPKPGDVPGPIAARSPAYPQAIPITVLTDPAYPALSTGLPLATTRLGERPFEVRVRVPKQWRRSHENLVNEWSWAPEGAPLNTYVLRIRTVGDLYVDVEDAMAERMTKLSKAEAVKRFMVENQTPDSFSATYLLVNPDDDPYAGYQRLTMERFLTLPDETGAQVEVSVTGRLSDRAGLADLLERVSNSVTR
ncbi:MAG: hypothetical protein QM714_14615 [Nocardioides sp.]|uniref:hypothetical protein n=1 Tax=Nocardioides sp. TaxID=35761 RepID=UPI0039E5205E